MHYNISLIAVINLSPDKTVLVMAYCNEKKKIIQFFPSFAGLLYLKNKNDFFCSVDSQCGGCLYTMIFRLSLTILNNLIHWIIVICT